MPPKPFRVGSVTRGPRSIQLMTRDPEPCSEPSSTVTVPVSFDRAPYFAAFVVSSWIISPNGTAVRGRIPRPPLYLDRVRKFSTKGFNSATIKSLSRMNVQERSASTLCDAARAWM